MEEVVILSAKRTPIGAYLGGLKELSAPQLGAVAISAAVGTAGVAPEWLDECLMGCVLPAGMGQAPARQAALFAKLPQSVRCTTVNRVCGSGLKTIMLGAQMLQTGDAKFVVAGGMESMSRVPYLLDKAREGYRLGPGKLLDSVVHDGLWDVYNDKHMGNCAELCSSEKKIGRADQDRFARQSYERAIQAIESGFFEAEIAPVPTKKETLSKDEEPYRAKLDKFPELKPAFDKAGTVTAANASSLSDGASALVLTTAAEAKSKNLKPIARILAQASHAQAPEWFTTAPVEAIRKVLEKAGLNTSQVDLFEINEAFSVVAIACAQALEIPESKLNIWGGAVALGHPIGSSGARIVTTLVHALKKERKRYGVAAICIGGGEASAIVVENLSA